MESGLLVLIGATTENPYFEVNPPLLSARPCSASSRSTPPAWWAAAAAQGLEAEGAGASTTGALAHLADGRRRRWPPRAHQPRGGGGAGPAATRRRREAEARSRPCDAEAALGTEAPRYGRDEHYDVISAFIKSVRGSDPQAAHYWLARMLEAGEDARFIARRLVILAIEDIGEADPLAWWSPPPRPTPSSTSGYPRPSSTWPRRSSTWPPPQVEPVSVRRLAGPRGMPATDRR